MENDPYNLRDRKSLRLTGCSFSQSIRFECNKKLTEKIAKVVDREIFDFGLKRLKEVRTYKEIYKEAQSNPFAFLKKEGLITWKDSLKRDISEGQVDFFWKQITSHEIYKTVFNQIDNLIKKKIKISQDLIKRYGAESEYTYDFIGEAYKIACLTAREFDYNKSVEENTYETAYTYRCTFISGRYDIYLPVLYLKQMGYKTKKIQNKELYKEIRKKLKSVDEIAQKISY